MRELYSSAVDVDKNVPIYDLAQYSSDDTATVAQLQNEWHHILKSGPGVFVLKRMYQNHQLLERVNEVFQKIIESERSSSKGDHFAGSGKNDRIWNSFQKHGLADPSSFIEYYSNPWIVHVSEAWLGPMYQLTAQVNIVKPGGAPQVSHRDYHLGFQTAEVCERFPLQTQIASQLLTLQGAVAHTDMPVESGPTRLLPFSQLLEDGYMAYRRPEFVKYFEDHYVDIALKMGDGLFFSPALFHAAGENRTADFNRSANLLQISSAFGKTMETVDTLRLIGETWDVMVSKYAAEGMSAEVMAVIAAIAKGYPFPTNLDRRPPAPGGMAPSSEQDLVKQGLLENWGQERIVKELAEMTLDSRA